MDEKLVEMLALQKRMLLNVEDALKRLSNFVGAYPEDPNASLTPQEQAAVDMHDVWGAIGHSVMVNNTMQHRLKKVVTTDESDVLN